MKLISIEKYCDDELQKRIADSTALIKSAYSCLKTGDFLQCAVRLQELDKFGKFSELEMNIFDEASREAPK
jgi:hypothetical protein